MNSPSQFCTCRYFAWVFILGCLLSINCLAAGKTLRVNQGHPAQVSLTDYFEILEDATTQLTLEQVLQPEVSTRFTAVAAPGAALSLGFTHSAYWLRLTLRNEGERPLERYFEIAYPLLSHLQFHSPAADGRYQSIETGNARPFATRGYQNRFFVFPVTLAAHSEQVLYIRAQSANAIVLPATLWEPMAYHQYERGDYLIQAWYFGMASAMVLFNLLLFVALRDSIYLLYVNFVGAMAIALAAQNGLAKQYVWPDTSLWSNIALYVWYSLSLAAFVQFSRRMLDTARNAARVDSMMKYLTVFLLLTPIAYYFSFQTFTKSAAILYAVCAAMILVVAILCAIKHQRSAYFFLAAFAMTILGGILILLRGLGMVPANALTMNGMQAGSALEMILLAIALADRFNVIRSDNEKAQRATLLAQSEKLVAEQRIIENLRSSERLLEERIGERTAELSATIDRLTQTQADLVQSDKLASLGALVAGVAHELNTPVGVVLTTASTLEFSATALRQNLADGKLGKSALTQFMDNTIDMAELMVRSSQRVDALLTSFKQVAVDQTSEHRRTFDLLSLIEDNIAALRPSFKPAPWVITIDVPTGILCDSYPGPLGQVVSNLVQNAAAHAFESLDRGTLSIGACVDADCVVAVFRDDGRGMEAAVLEHIFEPFYTTRFGHGGSGLGLSISLNIVTGVLGGTLAVSSELGKGTSFTLKFPLVAPNQAQNPRKARRLTDR